MEFEDTLPLGTPSADPAADRKPPWWRYQPNYLPVGERLLYSLISLTWIAWAAIGLLSGHMFFLISRGGPLHFSGLPALVFSAAVLAGAAACGCQVVDHYDRRNNEAAYRRMRKALWYGAGTLFLLAILVAIAEMASLLPLSDGRLGLLPARKLQTLLASSWLASKLQPRAGALHFWTVMSLLWFLGGAALFKRMGWLETPSAPAHAVRTWFAVASVMVPAVLTFALSLLADLSIGHVADQAGLAEEQVKAKVAWYHSMLVACLGVGLMMAAVSALVVLRRLGLLPSLEEELARKHPS